MGAYAGQTEPVAAADIAEGDLLVHDAAHSGYLMVTDVRDDRNAGMVSLQFETGESQAYKPDQQLHRVVPNAHPEAAT
jgi:hypothetical protein